MPTFRYHLDGTWYKGNTHVHSTASDGGRNFHDLAKLYADAGYHFLCRTDHWVASEVSTGDLPKGPGGPLLWLDGIELDGWDRTGACYHVVALGTFKGIHREMGLDEALQSARLQNGMLVLAHPQWTGNSFEDALRWRFDGVEVYNHACRWLNGKSDGSAYWNAMLERIPGTLALAADDTHLRPDHPGWNGGWVMVNSPECSQEAILEALRLGNFYSSCGPEIDSIQFDGKQVTIQSSPVQFARLAGPGSKGARTGSFDGKLLTEAVFQVPASWAYVYVEIEDAQGRRAWTNPLFV